MFLFNIDSYCCLCSDCLCFLVLIFQSIAIGYKRANPSSVVSVQGYDPRPCLRVKASSSSQSFRRFGFVDAIKEFDPTGSLGLLDPDFRVCFLFQMFISVFLDPDFKVFWFSLFCLWNFNFSSMSSFLFVEF